MPSQYVADCHVAGALEVFREFDRLLRRQADRPIVDAIGSARRAVICGDLTAGRIDEAIGVLSKLRSHLDRDDDAWIGCLTDIAISHLRMSREALADLPTASKRLGLTPMTSSM